MPNLDNYKDREQAYVKHCLLEEYLPEWGYKIGSKWDNLVYVDGFAGPWKVDCEDLSDSSFSIALNALKNLQHGLGEKGRPINVKSILVEQDPEPFELLQRFANR